MWRRNRTRVDLPGERELMDGELCWKGDSEAEEGAITGKGSIIAERAAASPGAAQKSGRVSMLIGVGVEEEAVIRRIQTPSSTIATSNTDTAKSRNYDRSQLLPYYCNRK